MEDYISEVHEMTNQFHKTLFELYDFYMDLYGTKVKVERLIQLERNTILPNRDQMISTLYGKTSSNDIYDRNNTELSKFDSIVIINKTDSDKVYNNNSEVITCYLNKNELDLGDKLSFNRYGKVYSYKVTEYKSYEDIIFEYELTGIKEYNNS